MKKIIFSRILLAAALAFSPAARAQDYPGKPIRIIVPTAPGAVSDNLARIVAEKLREKWDQPVIVENRAGAAGNIGAEAVSRAAPDGYTLLFAVQPTLVVNKSLYAKLAYDPDAFVPISVVAAATIVLVIHPKVAADSVQQLIALAKANPDRLNYASAGSGSTQHLTSELFKSRAGVKIIHVPYKGNPAAVVDLLSGQVDMMFAEISTALPHIRTGRLRALAIANEKRSSVLPDIPAMSEVLPGFAVAPWWGMVAPPRTPSAIAEKISAAVAEVLRQPDVAKRLLDMGSIEAIGNSPAEMVLFMRQERERWGNLIRAIGATAD